MVGQTQSEIRALLASAGLSPRHRYGQNFLVDLNLMRKVVAAAELQVADTVLEVGCGTGSLTEMLLEAGPHVVGVEIDHGLQSLLHQRLGENPRFSLVSGDALAGKHEINPDIIAALRSHPPAVPGQYKLVANLPYQIATPLLMELLHVQPRFSLLTCTIQKEVGQRLTAAPDTDAYGPISVIAATLADVRVVATFPPTAFWPRPKVESVLVTIQPLQNPRIAPQNISAFVNFVRNSFLHRRKMIRKTLQDLVGRDEAVEALERAGLNPQARPEALGPPAWRALFQHCRTASP
jgi:16S rRNA (adenine1518-N6/adenine1519-N6)-dimethyltransferase